ncbi:MAG TPA: sulfite exporter TauE/SafE family protein [Rhodopila sp.]|nr:sulfite exporter TauE/SafE family protein [Rhodopila sp.]
MHLLTYHVPFMLSGFIVGLLIGQTGMGGGSLMTPLLMLVFGVHPATAVGTDLLYASATKTVGTLVHGMNHTIDWRITRRLATGSIPATLLTMLAMSRYNLGNPGSGHIVSFVLGIMLVLTALSLIFRQRFLTLVGTVLARISPRQARRLTILTGAIMGVLVTVSSVGAGALGVTALLLLYPGVPMAVIVGSDIAHAVPLTLLAGIGHWWLGSVDWPMLAALLSGSIPGIILGSYLSAHIPEAVLRPILAATLVIVGGRLVY